MNRLHRYFVSIGVCLTSKNTTFREKNLPVLVGSASCVIFSATIAATFSFFHKYFVIDLPLALNGFYVMSCVLGLFATVVTTFGCRQELSDIFIKLQKASNISEYLYICSLSVCRQSFTSYISLVEFQTKVSPDLMKRANDRCEKITKFLVDYFTMGCVLPLVFLTCTLILALSILEHGSDFGEYLYLPYGVWCVTFLKCLDLPMFDLPNLFQFIVEHQNTFRIFNGCFV